MGYSPWGHRRVGNNLATKQQQMRGSEDVEVPGGYAESRCCGDASAFFQVRVYDPASPQRRPVLEATYGEYPLTAMTLTPEGK